MINTHTRTVYRSHLVPRDFLTKRSAIVAEANSMLLAKYPTESYESDTGYGYHWKEDEFLVRVHKRLIRLLSKKYKGM